MAKLVSLTGLHGEVATIAGPIVFENGVAEVDDEIAAQLQVGDIRVELTPVQEEEPQKEEPQKEAPAPKPPVKKPTVPKK